MIDKLLDHAVTLAGAVIMLTCAYTFAFLVML